LKVATKTVAPITPPEEKLDMNTPLSWKEEEHFGYHYDKKEDKWVSVLTKPQVENNALKNKLKIVTYNLDGAVPFTTERGDMLLNVVKDIDPDIITLQEVRNIFLKDILLPQQWIRDSYYISDISLNQDWNYRITLSKHPIKSLITHNLHSYRDRTCLVTEIALGLDSKGKEFAIHVANQHLDPDTGSEMAQVRLDQMKVIYEFLQRRNKEQGVIHRAGIVIGDLNVYQNESVEMVTSNGVEYKDVWKLLRGDEDGFTYDSVNNTWCERDRKKFNETFRIQQRHDRVLQSNDQPCLLKPVSIDIIGTKSLGALDPKLAQDKPSVKWEDIFPSDHFGLSMVFNIIPN